MRARQKRPVHNDWPRLKISADQVPEYFGPDSNVGVVLGDESGGLVDVDFDCPEASALADELLPASREFGRAGSPRSHRLYYAQHARTEKFQQPIGGNKQKMLVELRANKTAGDKEGLQTVFPGSIHESGELVEWEDIRVAIARVQPEPLRLAVARLAAASMLVRTGWSRDRALAFAREPGPAQLREVADPIYERIARWLGLPTRAQSAPAPRSAPAPADNRLKRAAAYLARVPGAVSGAGGHDQTWAAALAVVRGFELSEGEAYDLLASDYNRRCDPPWTERELRHKVVDALNNGRVELGYLLKQERTGRAADRPKSDSSARNDSTDGAREPTPSITPAEWDPPLEFDLFDLPPFPVETLPSALGEFVQACAEATQTPLDLSGMLTMAACAAAVAKRAVIEVKPGYREPLNLFVAVVLPPGERKSAVLREVSAPLVEWEAKAADACKNDIARAAQRYAISQKRLDAVASTAAKSKNKEERRHAELELEELAESHAKLKVPVEPRILADDATPEALGSLLAQHGGRIAIFSAEGGIFQQMTGKYSESSSLDVYLKAHAGDEIRVDRKGRPSERIPDPALTLGLAVQPAILEALADDRMLRGTGLVARFLYALPTSMLGSRKTDATPIPDSVRAAYASALRKLLVIQETPRPIVFTLSPEAYGEWRAFSAWLEPQLGEFGELASMRDWASKLAGVVARIAGILGVLRVLSTNPLKANSEDHIISTYVDRGEMVRSVTLGKYLLAHAGAAISSMGANPTHQAAKHILKWIGNRALPSFTRREVQQSTRRATAFDEPERLDRALEALEERGFLRRVSEPTGKPGRPSIRFEVNPQWQSQIAQTGTQYPQNQAQNASHPLREREPGEDDE